MVTGTVQNRAICFAAMFGLLALAGACNRRNVNAPKIKKAVTSFNDRFNSSEFHEIYVATDERLRKSVSESEFSSKLSELRRLHGPIQSSTVNGFQAPTRWDRFFPPSTEFIGYYNHCSDGGFQSLFIFDVTGEEAKLVEFDTDIDEHNKKLQN
jgi:hypothetical protein